MSASRPVTDPDPGPVVEPSAAAGPDAGPAGPDGPDRPDGPDAGARPVDTDPAPTAAHAQHREPDPDPDVVPPAADGAQAVVAPGQRRPSSRVQRLAVVVAAGAVLTALYAWFAPLTVPANRGLPFGCGSPSHPNDQPIARAVCTAALDTSRSTAIAALLVAVLAVVLAVALRVLAPRWGDSDRPQALVLGVLGALPLLAAAAITLSTVAEARSADGDTVVGCGTALRPVTDAFAKGLCSDIPGARLAAGLGLAGAAVLVGVGLPFVAGATRRGARVP